MPFVLRAIARAPGARSQCICRCRSDVDPISFAFRLMGIDGHECTSTVSSTLITPGCRKVRSFFRAFFARGNRARLAVMSKENMLQFDPSSYWHCQQKLRICRPIRLVTYSSCTVVKCPDGLINIDDVSEGIRKGRPLGYGGRDCRFQEIHGGRGALSGHNCCLSAAHLENTGGNMYVGEKGM